MADIYVNLFNNLQVTYKGDSTEIMFFPDSQDVHYAHFTQISLTQDSHNISVQAINKLFKFSEEATLQTFVDTSVPIADRK